MGFSNFKSHFCAKPYARRYLASTSNRRGVKALLKCPLSFLFLLFSSLLALPGAKPCGARRAERLGRSGGQGQQRPRRECRHFPGSLLLSSSRGFSPRVVGRRHPLPLGHRWPRFDGPLHCRLRLRHTRFHGCRNLLPSQRSPAIFDGDTPVPPFTYQHFGLRGCAVAVLRRQLKPPVLVAHHPVVADRALAFQTENPVQFCRPRRASMVVLRLRSRSRKPPIVFRQIVPLQIHVGVFVTGDLLAPQFLHQPVLMRSVLAFHSPLGLRRTGRDHLDPQLRAHAPKLRDWLFPPQLLLRRGRTFVQILPIYVHRLRHPVTLDPSAHRIRHRPDGLLLAQLRPRRAGRVIHQVDQAALRPALLQPGVKAAVHLHHLSKMLLALAPATMLPPLPLLAPQSHSRHPAPQRLAMDRHPILRRQMLGRQRWPKPLAYRPAVFLPHPLQHFPPKLLLRSAMRWLPCAAVLQSRSSLFPIPLPQSLRLPVTHTQQPAHVHNFQLPAPYTSQHFYTSQFPLAHRCPPQSDRLSEVLLRGHFYRGQKGTLSSRHNTQTQSTGAQHKNDAGSLIRFGQVFFPFLTVYNTCQIGDAYDHFLKDTPRSPRSARGQSGPSRRPASRFSHRAFP